LFVVPRPPCPPLSPYTTLFRSDHRCGGGTRRAGADRHRDRAVGALAQLLSPSHRSPFPSAEAPPALDWHWFPDPEAGAVIMHPRAGQQALPDDLADRESLPDASSNLHPHRSDPEQAVSFGTSGHRGSSLDTRYNEDHIAATTQAIVEYRAGQGISGPLFIGRDTHALSRPAFDTALEV